MTRTGSVGASFPHSPVLVVQTSFLGDTILTTPLLERLAADRQVDVLVTPGSAAILRGHPAVREVIVFDKRGRDRGAMGTVRMAGRLRAGRYGEVLLAQRSVRSGVLAMASGAARRIGFEASAGTRFYSESVPYIENAHHAERLLALADPSRAETLVGSRPRPARLFPDRGDEAAVDDLLGSRDPRPIVVLAPGSVWATKRWPGYPALAAVLATHWRIAVIGGVDDRPLAEAIAAAAQGPVVDATGRLALLGAAALIGRSAAIVTNDSSPLHLASAMNTPTVAIFGPTVPAFGFGPLADRSVTVGLDALPCRPCDRHGPRACPLGHWRCMRDISPAAVAAHLSALTSLA